MDSDFFTILKKRTTSCQVLGHNVNLSLSVQVAANQGNKDLLNIIEEITNKVQKDHRYTGESNKLLALNLNQNFIFLISEFESFIVDIMTLILEKHPKKLNSISFKLSEIVEIQDTNTLVSIASERFLNSIMYKRANEYKNSLLEILSAKKSFLEQEWPLYCEIKARRDIGIHNDWIINDTYRKKISEVGIKTKSEGYYPISNEYFWDTMKLLYNIMEQITKHCMEKFSSKKTPNL